MLTIPKTRRGAPVKPSRSVLNQIGSLCFKSGEQASADRGLEAREGCCRESKSNPIAGHQRFRVKRGFHLERPSLASCAAFFSRLMIGLQLFGIPLVEVTGCQVTP
jgi:hypothetical protein